MFDLTPHGNDCFVGTGPRYPWGGLYGGQVVAQALRAAAHTTDAGFTPHSIRAYFIRRGEHTEPVRYEVDRIRNGRSFITRRVVARQAVGAILNAECSFQRPEDAAAVQTMTMPEVPSPDSLVQDSFSDRFDRCFIPADALAGQPHIGTGRMAAWIKVNDDLPDGGDDYPHQCWLAFTSDDLPHDTVRATVRSHTDMDPERIFGVSLDHTVWFHRPMRADRWHLHDFTTHHLVSGRGLAVGHVYSADGEHVATVAQEVLLRERRDP